MQVWSEKVMEQFQIGDVTIQRVIKDDENLSDAEEHGEEYQSEHGEDIQEHGDTDYAQEPEYPPQITDDQGQQGYGEHPTPYGDSPPREEYADDRATEDYVCRETDYGDVRDTDIPVSSDRLREEDSEVPDVIAPKNMEESQIMERVDQEEAVDPEALIAGEEQMDDEQNMDDERLNLETDPDDPLPPELDEENNPEVISRNYIRLLELLRIILEVLLLYSFTLLLIISLCRTL